MSPLRSPPSTAARWRSSSATSIGVHVVAAIGRGGRTSAATSRSRAEIRVRERRFGSHDRRVAAIERQLGRFRIECVLALELVDRAIEHEPHALFVAIALDALEHAAYRAGLFRMLGPQPHGLARRESQVVEIDRIGHRDTHADSLAERRFFVDDS